MLCSRSFVVCDVVCSRYGADAVDSVISSFQPLEWSICENRSHVTCMAKVTHKITDGVMDSRVCSVWCET